MPVNVSGVKQLQKALREFDPELQKKMSKTIRAQMIPIRDKARGYLPSNDEVLSGWSKSTASAETIKFRAFPKYDYMQARQGIVYRPGTNKRNNRGYAVSHYVANVSAPGSIYETAGRKTTGGQGRSLNPDAGIQFIQALPPIVNADTRGQAGRPGRKNSGRLIYRAWAEKNNQVYVVIVNAINDAATDFNKTTKLKVAA